MHQIQKVSYKHDALIDLILADPMATQKALALHLGVTPMFVSYVVNSDSFKARLAERKGDLIDPQITLSFEQRLAGVNMQAIDIVSAQLEKDAQVEKKTDLAVKMLELGSRAAGYGARQQAAVTVNNYVAVVPAKATSTEEWLANSGRGGGVTIDTEVT